MVYDSISFQTGLNVCVILLSEIVWEKFRGGTGVREPFIIHFPDYSKGVFHRAKLCVCVRDYPLVVVFLVEREREREGDQERERVTETENDRDRLRCR